MHTKAGSTRPPAMGTTQAVPRTHEGGAPPITRERPALVRATTAQGPFVPPF